MVSDYADYMNGECVTLDGGEWLRAGQFSNLDMIPSAMWDQLEAAIRKTK